MNSGFALIKKSVRIVLTILLSFFWSFGISQYISTPPTLDGNITAGEYGSVVNGSNQITNSGVTTYMTWDVNKLYIGVSGASVNDATIIYIDKDNLIPVNGGNSLNGVSSGQLFDNTNFSNLPYKADLVIYAKNGTFQYMTNNNGTWSSASTAGMAYADNNLATAAGIKELSISWSVLGNPMPPSTFNFFSYNTTSSGNVYNQIPINNQAGNIGTSAMYERYFNVTSTANGSSTLPFSRECYVFNNSINETSVGSMSVYDFTMNTTGKSIIRDATGGDWAINGNMVAAAGSIDFGNPVGNNFGNSIITQLTISGATINMDQTNKPLNISGNITITSGSLILSSNNSGGGNLLLGGNFTKNGGTFNCNGRKVNFNGNTAQTWSSTISENIDYLTVSNSSANGVAVSNITAGTANVNSININTGTLLTLISGTLTINNSSIGTINGTLRNAGGTIIVPTVSPNAAIISVSSTGTFIHFMDGSSIPVLTWNPGSSCEVTGWQSTTTLLAGLNQNFYNFKWNSPSQTVVQNFGASLFTVKGNLTIASTGTGAGAIALTNSSDIVVNINGNFIQTGGKVYLSQGTGKATINLTGNFTQSGGSIDFNPNLGSGAKFNISGDYTVSGGSIIHSGIQTNGIIVFNGTSNQNINSSVASNYVDYQIYSNAIVSLASNFQINNASLTLNTGSTFSCGTYIINGSSSTTTLQSGSTLKTASLDASGALTTSGAKGSIQTTNRNYNSSANYEFNGNNVQFVGDFSTTLTPANTVNSLIINNTSAINTSGLNLSFPIIITGSLNLISGKLTTNSNSITVQASAIISGGSSTSFVDGAITEFFNTNLPGTQDYLFPVGSGTSYLPFGLMKLWTGNISPSITISAFNSNSGGSIDGSLTGISNSEYWSAILNSGNFTKAILQLSRTTALGSYNTLAKSNSSNGVYSSSGGSIVNSTTINSNIYLTSLGYFVLGTLIPPPTITLVHPSPLTNIVTPDNSGYMGQILNISGTNYVNSGLTITIGGATVGYTFINNTQISVLVPTGITSGFLVVTNTVTGGFAKVAFTYNGYISNAASDWNSVSTWLGGAVPAIHETVTIKDPVTLASDATFPDFLTITNTGSFIMNPGSNPAGAGIIIYNHLINNGTLSMANNTSITLKDAAIFDNGPSSTFSGSGNSFVSFQGSGTITGTIQFNTLNIGGNVNLSNAVSIANNFSLNAGSMVLGNAPSYLNTSTLVYNTGGTYNPGLEWSSSGSQPGSPFSIQIAQNNIAIIDISSGTKPTVLNGKLIIGGGGKLDFNNSTQSFTINGDLLMQSSSQLNLSTQAGGDLILKSDWSNMGAFIPNNGAVIFNNTTKDQNFYGEQPTTFNILTIDKGLTTMHFANTMINTVNTINTALNVTSGNVDFNNKNITLKSTAATTASITKINGVISNATNVTVERYFPAKRAWVLVSVPLNSSQTINAAWQEGQTNTSMTNSNTVPGYGTHISGPQPGLGFDYTPRNRIGLQYYNNLTDSWVAVPNTNATSISSQNAYALFLRGSRQVDLSKYQFALPDPTTLRITGILQQGDQVFNINASNRFTMIGNPYPCSIDFHLLTRAGGLGDKFTVWDPYLTGAYVIQHNLFVINKLVLF